MEGMSYENRTATLGRQLVEKVKVRVCCITASLKEILAFENESHKSLK